MESDLRRCGNSLFLSWRKRIAQWSCFFSCKTKNNNRYGLSLCFAVPLRPGSISHCLHSINMKTCFKTSFGCVRECVFLFCFWFSYWSVGHFLLSKSIARFLIVATANNHLSSSSSPSASAVHSVWRCVFYLAFKSICLNFKQLDD